MNLRPRHLVCLILLLTALRGAEGSVLPAGEYAIDGRYGIVLSQDRAGVWTEVKNADHKSAWPLGTGGFFLAARLTTPNVTFNAGLPPAALATYRTAWTMRPPAAQCVFLHAVTGCDPTTPPPAL